MCVGVGLSAAILAFSLVCRDPCSLACPLARTPIARVARRRRESPPQSMQTRPNIDPKSTRNRPKIDPESTPNRPQIDPKSAPGSRGAPRGSARASPDAFRGPRGGPEKPRAPPREPGRTPENRARPSAGVRRRSGGPLGRLGNARRAPRRQSSARLATQGARSGVLARFWDDFRAIWGRFSDGFSGSVDTRTEASREGPTLISHWFFLYRMHVGLLARTAKIDQKPLENRSGSAPGARHSRKRRKSSEIGENPSRNRPTALRQAASGPSGRLRGLLGAPRGAPSGPLGATSAGRARRSSEAGRPGRSGGSVGAPRVGQGARCPE